MGILTLLRNAFGRSRKGRAAEAEGADRLSAQPSEPQADTAPSAADTPVTPAPATPEPSPTVPEPRRSSPDEHELVSAAFDNIKVPRQPEDGEPHDAQKPVAETTEPAVEAEAEADGEELTEEPAEEQTEEQTESGQQPAPEAENTAEAGQQPEPTAEEPVAPLAADDETRTNDADGETETNAQAPQAEAPQADTETKTEPEPQAAADDDAPQAPPSADDETRTSDADGEADGETETNAQAPQTDVPDAPQADVPQTDALEADAPETATAQADAPQADLPQTDAPQADAPQAALPQTAAPQADAPQADAPQADAPEADVPEAKRVPATPLTKVKARTPSLATAYKAATATLKKTDLTGARAKLYLVLDRSASMRPYYKDGSAQALADQTLALAAHLDPETTVHVVFFSTEVDGTTDLTLAPDHETKIDDVHAGLGRMGRTSYHAAVAAVLAHYDQHSKDDAPALVVFQTDGAPDAKTPATQALTEAASSHPAVFFSFVAFGEHDNKAFDYLRKLKTANTSFFHAGPTPRELTDTELYEGVLTTWRP